MNYLDKLYKPSLTLLTDLYQLTMAQGYWKQGKAEDEACFYMFFRDNPFQGGYAIAAGIEPALAAISEMEFDADDINYLASLHGAENKAIFEAKFLEYLSNLKITLDIKAVPEGSVVFAHEPLLQVRGPLLQAQLIETFVLNIINFQTLVATKAARICSVSAGQDILEFGLRRAQGPDGAISAARAAYIGGASATSNLLAGKLLGIPVKGTHAHSWVMSFASESEAFAAYAESAPGNVTLLVDTYNTLSGVRNAIDIAIQMQERGENLLAIRLDSGDLAWLSQKARELLDAAGLKQVKILASNDLDEYLIEDLQHQGARIDDWGVGTKLVTSFDQPALGGVYKLSALRNPDGSWRQMVKLSEQPTKTSTPGILGVRRYLSNGIAIADMIYDELNSISGQIIVHPLDPTRQRDLEGNRSIELLRPTMNKGQLIGVRPTLSEIRQHRSADMSIFDLSVKRFSNPHEYPVGLEKSLHERKMGIIVQIRQDSRIDE